VLARALYKGASDRESSFARIAHLAPPAKKKVGLPPKTMPSPQDYFIVGQDYFIACGTVLLPIVRHSPHLAQEAKGVATEASEGYLLQNVSCPEKSRTNGRVGHSLSAHAA